MITSRQIKAARALLNIRQKDLADLAELTNVTIANIEADENCARPSSIMYIKKALTSLGVNFIGDDGVSLSEGVTKIYEGVDELKKFFNVLYEKFLLKGGIVRISGVREEIFTKYLGQEFATLHSERVAMLDITFRVLVERSDSSLKYDYPKYREIPSEYFFSLPTYIYDDTVTHIIWGKDVKAISIKNSDLARAQSLQFEMIWNQLNTA